MDEHDGTSRRKLLQAGALGAGAVIASGALGTESAAAVGSSAAGGARHGGTATDGRAAGRIDTEHPRFTLAVVPDTQYQFDQDRGDAAPLTATFKY
ncbi:MAG: Tat pathway signal sequence domain protein, partial [Kribbellaceae bacterium]|nr:Tat pathway signal sequence domain protein [Kribbellaceae bacterium]